jgi:hypothetical protein
MGRHHRTKGGSTFAQKGPQWSIAMILTFHAPEVRKQIMHAKSAAVHRTADEGVGPAEAALHLGKRKGRYFLTSNGLPETGAPAYAVRADVGATGLDAGDDAVMADFVEPMSLEAFTKALGKPVVTIVVTRTYINVLGGQPDRPQSTAPYQTFRRARVPTRG